MSANYGQKKNRTSIWRAWLVSERQNYKKFMSILKSFKKSINWVVSESSSLKNRIYNDLTPRKLNRKNLPRGHSYHFHHWFCFGQYMYHFFPTLKCYIMKDLHFVIAKWDKCKMIERNSMIKCQKSVEIVYNHLIYA